MKKQFALFQLILAAVVATSFSTVQANEPAPAPIENAFATGTGNVALTQAEIEALQQFINRSKVALETALSQAEGQNANNTVAILRQAIRDVVLSSSGNEPHRELILRVLLNQALALTDGVPATDGQTLAAQPILPNNTPASVKAMVLKASVQLALQFVVADQANVTAAQASPAPYLNAANQRLSMAFNWSQTIMNSGGQLKMLVTILQHWLNMLTLPQFGQLPQLAEFVLSVQNTLSLAHAGINDRGQHPLIRTRVVRDIRSILDQGNGWVRILDPNATPTPLISTTTPPTPTPAPSQPQTGRYAWGTDREERSHCYPASSNNRPIADSSPVDDTLCGVIYAWGPAGRGNNEGDEYCFAAKSSGEWLLGRTNVDDSLCHPIYIWWASVSGGDRCYRASRANHPLAGRDPVDNSLCQ